MGTVFAAASGLSGIAMPLGNLLGGSAGVVTSSSAVIAVCGLAVLGVGIYWMFDPVTRKLPAADDVDQSWFASPEKTNAAQATPSL